MADHGYFEELICAELDGELSAGEAAELRAHLEGCERCRAFREAMAAVEGVTARNLPAPPAELTANVMAAVRAEVKNKKKKGKILSFPGRSLAVAAAAVLVLWAGVRATDLFSSKSSSGPMMAAAVETTGAAVDEGVEAETVQSREYASEEAATDSAEAPAEEPAAGTGSIVDNDTPPTQGAIANVRPSGTILCQISSKDGVLRSLPKAALPKGLLAPDEPCEAPDREPDYIIRIFVPNGDPEEYWLWEEAGTMIVETNTGEIGYTVSAEIFSALLK